VKRVEQAAVCRHGVVVLSSAAPAKTAPPRPPALNLPDVSQVRWTSFTKAIREPEQNWPAQICERPIHAAQIGGRGMALVADPETVRAILTGPEQRFIKWRIYDRVVAAGAGRRNISATEGADCLRQRRILAPMLGPDAVPELGPLFLEAARRAVESWRRQYGEVRIDAGLETTRITLDVIWRTMFGAPARSPVTQAVDAAARAAYAAQVERRLGDVAGSLVGLMCPASEPRSEAELRANPFLGMGQPSLPDGLSAEEVHDNARLFLNAGHETTTLTLTWTLWLLGRDPEVQARVRAEIDAVAGGGPVTPEHLGRLAFTGQVVNETMRLLPPGPIVVRQALAEETFCGETLPPGSLWALCIYGMHRNAALWDDPHDFRPDRFAPGSAEPRHRFAYLPFSAGRHGCIGSAFGWAEALTVLATILQAFEVEADPHTDLRPRMVITLRPDGPAPLILTPRSRPPV
jgi:cytochrome P450